MKKTEKSKKNADIYIKNNAVFHNYKIESGNLYEAGIVLKGCEVKSVIARNASLSGAYCRVSDKNEITLIGMYIKKYKNGSFEDNTEEYRDRKLLLHKDEIRKIRKILNEKGWTAVPVNIHLSKGGSVNVSGVNRSKKKNIIKIDIAVAQGNRKYDKREIIKKRDTDKIAKINIKYGK